MKDTSNILSVGLGSQVEILGVRINRFSKEQVVTWWDSVIQNNGKVSICIANAHTLNLAYKDINYLGCLEGFYVLNDGVGVSIASKILYGEDFPDNLNGTDLIPYYIENSMAKLKIFLLGGKPGIAELAAEKFRKLSSNILIAGCYHGYFNHFSDENIVNQINESGANILLVAFGNPLQEKWIYAVKDKLTVNVMVGVGALFDFMAGVVPRAQVWLRNLKGEWVYRLILEPKRLWRRYIIGNPLFLVRVLNQKVRNGIKKQ